MSYKYTLDSSAWIEYFGGSSLGRGIKAIVEQEQIATSVIALVELADKYERENEPFNGILPFIEGRAAILPLTISLGVLSAKIKKEARKKNPKFGIIDAVHLATAKEHKSTLLTIDNDFDGISDALIIREQKPA